MSENIKFILASLFIIAILTVLAIRSYNSGYNNAGRKAVMTADTVTQTSKTVLPPVLPEPIPQHPEKDINKGGEIHVNKVNSGGWFWIIIIASSVWVLIDAKSIGVKKGQIQGMGNLGPLGWFFVCLFLWIIGFPFYLAKRSEYKRINSNLHSEKPSINTTAPQKNRISIIGWIGIIFFGGIACLALFGQRDDGTRGVDRIASGGVSTYNIRVEGSSGMPFSGSYMGVTSGGSQQQSVDGTVPANYTVSGRIISATFQKKSEVGNLIVSIECNGHVVQESSTSTAYGVVSLATK